MLVSGAQEAGLGRVRVNPANDYDILVVAELPDILFAFRVARVCRALLVRNQEMVDEQGVVN